MSSSSSSSSKERLFELARQGKLASLEALVKESGEQEDLINAVDEGGWTALHYAALCGHSSMVKWLLSDSGGRAAGFNSLFSEGSGGWTALHLACSRGHLESVQALVEGSKVENEERENVVNGSQKGGWTALHLACFKGHLSIVRWLLFDSGGRAAGFKSSTITGKTNRSESCLHLAVAQRESVETIQALLSGCTSAERINLLLCIDKNGWTALHWAARYRQPDSIRHLLHHPETQLIVDYRDRRGMTALHRAVIGGIDEESREEWLKDISQGGPHGQAATMEELLKWTVEENYGTQHHQQAAQIDPNVGLKFD